MERDRKVGDLREGGSGSDGVNGASERSTRVGAGGGGRQVGRSPLLKQESTFGRAELNSPSSPRTPARSPLLQQREEELERIARDFGLDDEGEEEQHDQEDTRFIAQSRTVSSPPLDSRSSSTRSSSHRKPPPLPLLDNLPTRRIPSSQPNLRARLNRNLSARPIFPPPNLSSTPQHHHHQRPPHLLQDDHLVRRREDLPSAADPIQRRCLLLLNHLFPSQLFPCPLHLDLLHESEKLVDPPSHTQLPPPTRTSSHLHPSRQSSLIKFPRRQLGLSLPFLTQLQVSQSRLRTPSLHSSERDRIPVTKQRRTESLDPRTPTEEGRDPTQSHSRSRST